MARDEPFVTLLEDFEPDELWPRPGEELRDELLLGDDLKEEVERLLFVGLFELLDEDEKSRDDTRPREVLLGEDLYEEEDL